MALVVQDLGVVPYREALDLQEALLARKLDGGAEDYLLLVEHEPVYTLGRAADEADLREADRKLGVAAIRVGRGGGVTFHGPGQLVAYPIVDLVGYRRDVGRYVRALEHVLIQVCRRFGVCAERKQGAPGVWVGEAKIASIGIGVRRWVTFHGVALNVSTDLTFFSHISACRMPSMKMTSLERLTGHRVSQADARTVFVDEFRGMHTMPESCSSEGHG